MQLVRRFGPLVLLSGFAALTLEMVWLRRLALSGGSAGMSAVATLSLYIGGLGIGGWLGGKKQWKHGAKSYALLELMVVLWALAFPTLQNICESLVYDGLVGVLLYATPLLLPPAILHGATLPALCSLLTKKEEAGTLYALNTLGAVIGTLSSAFVLMPNIGVRGSEVAAGIIGLMAAIGGWRLRKFSSQSSTIQTTNRVKWEILLCAFIAGGTAMALELIWSRLGALLIGGSVYAFSIVLAVFLIGIAIGAEWGRRKDTTQLRPALALTGLLALAGGMLYGVLPHGLALGWDYGLPPLVSGAILLSIAMAGAPIASGMVFSLCIKAMEGHPKTATGQILAANAVGGMCGVLLTGAFGLSSLGIAGVLLVCALSCVIAAEWMPLPTHKQWKRGSGILILCILVALKPPWDPAVYAVGLYNRIGEFVDFFPGQSIVLFMKDGI